MMSIYPHIYKQLSYTRSGVVPVASSLQHGLPSARWCQL
jgi:hypothetical protein